MDVKKMTAVTVASLSVSGLIGVSPAAAVSRLPCSATMSNTRPVQYGTTYVQVRTAAGARVTTAAAYKSTTNRKVTAANSSGRADVAYMIYRATRGHQVMVSVTVQKGTQSSTCSASFTPR